MESGGKTMCSRGRGRRWRGRCHPHAEEEEEEVPEEGGPARSLALDSGLPTTRL